MRCLGLVVYYKSFCCNFSTVVAPLMDLLKSKTKFVWYSSCQLTFKNVKSLLCSAPVLLARCLDKTFTLHVDASNVDGRELIIQSVSLRGRLILISITTLYLGIAAFCCLLIPVHQLWYTDHNPLTFMYSLECLNQRLIRWSLFLQSFCLDIQHVRGTENVVADAQLRIPRTP